MLEWIGLGGWILRTRNRGGRKCCLFFTGPLQHSPNFSTVLEMPLKAVTNS